jgi:LacI family transcriptional regulator
MRRVTIRDVAAEAGVSIGTASKALNGQGKLRQETRERVAEVAQRLGFAPNVLARALLAGRSFTVGLITSDSFGRFSIPVMLGAEDALGDGQVSVFMCDTRDDPLRERGYVSMLVARRVDGLIVTGRRAEPRPPVIAGPGIPVVYAMTSPVGEDGPAVLADDAGAGDVAARHLMAGGRRRLGHITGPERFLAARRRAAGFSGFLGDSGMDVHGGVRFGEWSEQWGRSAATSLLEACPDVDAVFCGSDQIARGVADTLRSAGRRVPDDVALVGVDNWEPMALGAQPPLTSVDLCLEEVGRVAAQMLLESIGGSAAEGVHTVPCRLVVRESALRGPVLSVRLATVGCAIGALRGRRPSMTTATLEHVSGTQPNQRFTFRLPAGLAEVIRNAADRRYHGNISAVITEAIEDWAADQKRRERGLRAMREYEAEYGEFTEEERTQARAEVAEMHGWSEDDPRLYREDSA